MQNGDEASLSNILAGWGILVKMLIFLEPQHIFYQILHTYTFYHCRDTGMQNGDLGWRDVISCQNSIYGHHFNIAKVLKSI